MGFRAKVIQVAGGTALAQGLLVLASPLLTRLYTPADFGVLAVFMSLVSVLVTVASLCFELALPIPEEEDTAACLLALCLLLVGLTALLSALVLGALRGRILGWMGAPALGPWLWLVPVSILGAGLCQVFTAWAIRKEAYGRIARTKVTQSLAQLLLQVGLGGRGPLGLLAGDAAGRTAGTFTLARLDWRGDLARLRRVTWGGIREAVRRYRRFPLLSGGTTFMNTLNLRLPGLLLAILYGPAVAGSFTLAQRVFGLPGSVVGASVAQVYFGECARLAHGGGGGMMALFRGTVRRMFLLGVPVTAVAAGAGWFLFPAVFGRAWKEAGFMMVLLAPMSLAQFAAACVGHSLVVLERQDLSLLREAVRAGLLAGGLLAAHLLRWGSRGAILLFGCTGTLAYLVYGAVTWYAIHRADLARGGRP